MKAKPRTLRFPPQWPTVVIVVVVILLLVHPTIDTDQIKAIETIVYLLAGSSACAAPAIRRGKPTRRRG